MLITNFSAGELSPLLAGRTDLQQYYSGARKLVNFDVIPTGGIKRRPGTRRLGTLHGNPRLIPMILDSSSCFVFEIIPNDEGGSTAYIWKNGAALITEGGSQASFQCPWNSLEEIKEVQYAQNYNVMTFVQKDHSPFQVEYSTGTGTFTVGTMTFDFTPDVELDDDYGKVYTWTGSALPYYNVIESKPYYWLVFQGKLYKWNHDGDITPTEGSTELYWEEDTSAGGYDIDEELFTTENKYPGAVAFFNSRLYLASTRNSQQKVWASAAPDVEGTRYNVFSTYTKYITVNRVIKDADIHYFSAKVTSGSTTVTGVTQDLSDIEDVTDYFVTSDYFAVGTKVVSYDRTGKTLTLSSAATGSSTLSVMSIQLWRNAEAASSDDYEYKVVQSNMTAADDSFFFEIASDQNDAVRWMASGKYLVIGSESANYVVPSGVTALSVQAVMDGRYGTDAIQATTVQTAVIFFAQGKKAIREYYYSSDTEAFVSNDIAIMDPDVLESPAVDFDFMANPYSRILITRKDGTLAVLLYEKSQGVMAWSHVGLGSGKIQSVAVTRGTGGSDIAYMAVKEDDAYYLESLDAEDTVYLDGWKTYSEDNAAGYPDDATVFNITQDKYTTKGEMEEGFIGDGDEAVIGYAFTSTIESMPILTQDITTKKRIASLLVRFNESWKPELQVTGKAAETFTGFTEPFTGLKEIIYPGDAERDVTFTLTISKPEACTVLAVNATMAD